MNTEQALTIITQVLNTRVSGTKEEHITIENAVKAIREALTPKEESKDKK